jgi:hypothetical protein
LDSDKARVNKKSFHTWKRKSWHGHIIIHSGLNNMFQCHCLCFTYELKYTNQNVKEHKICV